MAIQNEVIVTGGVAQDLLPNFHGNGGFIINAITEDMWINFGADAAADTGEKIYKDNPAKFSAMNFPEFNARVSIVSATTGAKFTIRPTS